MNRMCPRCNKYIPKYGHSCPNCGLHVKNYFGKVKADLSKEESEKYTSYLAKNKQKYMLKINSTPKNLR